MTGRRVWLAASALAASAVLGLLGGCGGGGGSAPPPTPSITVTSPDGGETWYYQGPDRDVTWTNTVYSGNVDIHYTTDTTGDPATWVWSVMALDIANTGSYPWPVPNESSLTCRVRVREAGGVGLLDESNGDFAISAPAISLDLPVGGESWAAGSTQTISWTGGGFAGVRVEFTRDGTWGDVVTLNALPVPVEDGSYQWPVTGPGSVNCLVRVSDWADGTPADQLSTPFTIAEITLTDPTGGEVLDVGSSQSITWTSGGVANVKIEVSRDGNWANGDGSDVEVLTASTLASAGTFPWTPGHPVSASCLVRISDAGTSGAVDISGATFTVAGITVTSPNGGEALFGGQDYEITWLSSGVAGNVDIYYTNDTTVGPPWTWQPVALTIANTGSRTWLVPADYSANCRVRVEQSGGGLRDESDGDFSIALRPMAGPFDYGPDVVTTYTWGGSAFVEETRRTFSYDLSGKTTTILEETWAGGVGPWENSVLTTYVYNVDDTVDTITVGSWNGASWDVDSVTTCNYSGGLMTSKDIDDLAAGTTSRILYTYTGGLLTREQTEESDGSTWTPTDAATYGYDASNRLSSGTIEAPDFFSGSLTQIGTLDQSYDAAGLLLLQVLDIDFFGLLQMIVEVGPTTYDTTDRLETMELAVTVSPNPADLSKAECFYDGYGRLEEVLAYDWNVGTSTWDPTSQTTYTNTNAGSSFTFQYESPTPMITWPWEVYGCGDVNPHLW